MVNVLKVFDNNVTAVDNLNLTIEDRDFLVLVGPSGCGKSTTLRLIAGLEDVTEGEIHIDDRLVTNLPPRDRNVAMVFQNYALYPHMTVYQNLAFSLKMRNLPKRHIDEKVEAAARILDIEELMTRKPKALSGGQRQRVALGRAIVRDAKVFLFDEPLSNLDAKLRVQMRAEIIKLHARLKTTMIYVTHDQVEAMTMGRRIVIMRDGKIQQTGSPMSLYDFPENIFVAGFIGSPAMNFIKGTITSGDGLHFQNEDVKIAVPEHYRQALSAFISRNVAFGIRPEDVRPHSENDKAPQYQTIKATVDIIEPMGNETLLTCGTGDNQLTVRSHPACSFQMGETIELSINMNRSHFFDAVTEMRIKT